MGTKQNPEFKVAKKQPGKPPLPPLPEPPKMQELRKKLSGIRKRHLAKRRKS